MGLRLETGRLFISHGVYFDLKHLEGRDMAEGKDSIKYWGDLKGDTYITLKEAAALTEYSADYIGQLIRAGKIDGKQVYTNVAWVTTEKAIRNYMDSKGKAGEENEAFRKAERLSEYLRYALYGAIGVLGCLLVIFLYILFVGIDHAVSDSYTQDFDPSAYSVQ